MDHLEDLDVALQLTSVQRVQQFLAREDAALKLYRGTDQYEWMAKKIVLMVSCPEPSTVQADPARATPEPERTGESK